MPNQGTLALSLLAVDGSPARDPGTFVSFIRSSDGQEIGSATRSLPPVRRFTLPAFPQETAIMCLVTPERYRHRAVGVFTLTDGETIQRNPTVFRKPDKWQPAFVRWNDLTADFDGLTQILGESTTLRVKAGKVLGQFTAAAYDAVDPGDRTTVYAKACLLNLHAKLRSLKEPVFSRKPWFGFVDTILEIGRERLIALVDAEMRERVRTIHDNIDDFELYKRTPVGDHHKNIPPGYTFTKSSMVSIKTKEEHGNVQLTLTPATDANGNAVTLLDADIDENGQLMVHLADLFKHRFSGGTHPYDIHEYLVMEDKSREIGYELT